MLSNNIYIHISKQNTVSRKYAELINHMILRTEIVSNVPQLMHIDVNLIQWRLGPKLEKVNMNNIN